MTSGRAIGKGLRTRQIPATRCQLGTGSKVSLFASRFCGRQDVYGSYDPATDRVFQVKKPVTRDVLLAHLQGRSPYGVYLLNGDRTNALVVDFDDGSPDGALRFLALADGMGVPAYIERSKSKGYHVWLFFPESGVPAVQARCFAGRLLSEIGLPDTEVFPKHDSLGNGVTYGNFINAPLFGQLVPQGRTVFVDPANSLEPFSSQWEFLQSVQVVSAEDLDRLVRGTVTGAATGSWRK